MAAKQAHAGYVDFRLRRARDHGAVGIAHYDVADPNRGTGRGALDLGAADFDMFAAAEILLDGGHEPWGDRVELNGSIVEPPPQPEAAQYQHPCDTAGDYCCQPDEPAIPRKQPPIGGQIAAVAPPPTAMSGREITPTPGVRGLFPSRERRALPILIRHARSGVPSSVAPS